MDEKIMTDNKEIAFKKPFMPLFDEFRVYLERIWETRRLTNNGPVQMELEQALCDYLGVRYISLFVNGTAALMIALKAMNLKGEVITTPFTFAATAQAIYWNQLKPVFVDINEEDMNISVNGIENAITSRTTAILPVHIFGNPCKVENIHRIANTGNLKVIYDSAHSFGVKMNDRPLSNWGDLSVFSFHATKIYSTIEGGAIVCHDEETKKHIEALKNNGLDPDHQLSGFGFNAKMNEVQAAYGLVYLKYVDRVIARHREVCARYMELLKDVKGLRMIDYKEEVKYNYSYFPVLIDPVEFGADRDELYIFLQNRNIGIRKYFTPLVSDFQGFRDSDMHDLPKAKKIAGKVLCLPLFYDITDIEIDRVAGFIIGLHEKKG